MKHPLSRLTTMARKVYSALNRTRIAGSAVKGDLHPFFRYLENRATYSLLNRVRRR